MTNGKVTPPKITPPDTMELCAVIYEWQYDTSPVVMKDFVNYEQEDSIRKYLAKKLYKSKLSRKRNLNRDWKLRYNKYRYYW